MCEQTVSHFNLIPTKRRHGWLRRVVPIAGTLFLWHDRIQQRHDLAKLDNDQRADIGLTVEAECAKAFWEG